MILHKVHDIDKGADPNLRVDKQAIRPLSTLVQPYVPIGSKGCIQAKPRLGQGRAVMRRKITQRFPMPPTQEKTDELKLLLGKRTIIQIVQGPILHWTKIISQPKMRSQLPLIQNLFYQKICQTCKPCASYN